jgi:hypothetical protein
VRPGAGVVQPASHSGGSALSVRPAALLPIVLAVLVVAASPQAAVLDGEDTTPPTITPTIAGTSGANGWYTSAVSVTWAVADAESPITSSSGCDAITLAADTAGTTVTCSATNQAGLTATNSVSLKIDTTPPAVSGGPVGQPTNKGWYTQPVSVAFSGSDPFSGVVSCTAPTVYAGPDSKNASVGGSCTNGAGLTAPGVAGFKYDASPPAIAAHLTGTQGSNGWYRSDVSVSWDVSDPHSGVTSTSGCGPATVSGDTAGTTVTCAATNDAGLTGQAAVQVRIDRTPPDTSITSGPSGTVISSSASFGVSASEAGSSFECSLDNATFGSCSSSASFTNLADGGHTFAVRAVDAAGNVDPTPASQSWTIRSAVPVLKVPAAQVVEATSPAGAVVTYAVSAQDGADPLPPDSIGCTPKSGSTFAIGATTVSCTATNSLGASAKASFSITVRDTSAPRLTVPAALTLTANAPVPAANTNVAAFLAGARAVDLADPAPTVVNDAPSVFPLGTTVVTFTARDSSGNTVSAKSSLALAVPGTPAAAGAPPAGTATGPGPARVDRTPPGDVQNVAVLSGDKSVSLSWRRPADADFDHVDVFRAEAQPGSEEAKVYSGPKLVLVDTGVANGVQYRYVVVAVDTSGNRSGGISVVASPQASLLVRPKDAARLKSPPKLTWKRVAGASYYNVQLWRDGVKLLSAWPLGTSFQLKRRWAYQSHRFRLTPGTYRWYVWPGIGARADVRYGTILGRQTFTITR